MTSTSELGAGEAMARVNVHMVSGEVIRCELGVKTIGSLMAMIGSGKIRMINIHRSPRGRFYINWDNVESVEVME